MKYIISACLFFSTMLLADGGFIPASGEMEVYTVDQMAVIRALPDSEELMILVEAWAGTPSLNFAWVVPLPSPPRIQEVDPHLFVDFANCTVPVNEGAGCSGPFFGSSGNDRLGNGSVTVIEYDTIGFLAYVLIHVEDPDTLQTWLAANGYEVPVTIDALLEHYLEEDWCYFFIAEVDSAIIDPSLISTHVGISFTFATPTLVYPMEITSLSASHETELILYTIDDHKMFFDGAVLKYANRIDHDEMNAIERDYPALAGYLEVGTYLTKLKRVYGSPEDMEDISLYQAADDNEYRAYYDPRSISGSILNSMLAPLGLMLLLLGCRRLYGKRRTGRNTH